MAVDWSQAPAWARFATTGPSGSLWHEMEPVLIYADPPYYVDHGGGQWKRISYASRNARLFRRPDSPQEASDARTVE